MDRVRSPDRLFYLLPLDHVGGFPQPCFISFMFLTTFQKIKDKSRARWGMRLEKIIPPSNRFSLLTDQNGRSLGTSPVGCCGGEGSPPGRLPARTAGAPRPAECGVHEKDGSYEGRTDCGSRRSTPLPSSSTSATTKGGPPGPERGPKQPPRQKDRASSCPHV